jgi:hypothetical protein
MAYQKIKSHTMTEAQLRELWKANYCKPCIIKTFDEVDVKFNESMFDHVFYESADRKKRDKSILSLNRLEKIYWIKDTLEDPTAQLKQGWYKDKGEYINDRRVAFVKGNYVVIIRFTGLLKAVFVTAYEMQVNIEKVVNSPDWIPVDEFVGKKP